MGSNVNIIAHYKDKKVTVSSLTKKHLNLPVAVSLMVLLSVTQQAVGAEADGVKNRACPDGWSLNTQVIPVLSTTSAMPWGVDTDDQQIARSELGISSVEDTLDIRPVTLDDVVNDPLTVASHCLAYRNWVVDGTEYFPEPNPVEPNPAVGWIPAAVF